MNGVLHKALGVSWSGVDRGWEVANDRDFIGCFWASAVKGFARAGVGVAV